MTTRKALLFILIANTAMLAVGAGLRVADTAQALPPAKEAAASGVTIPYPGRLADEAGAPVVDGLYDFTFTLYDAKVGGDPLWSEVQDGVPVREGAFSTSLGSENLIPAALLGRNAERVEVNRTLWLDVGVRGPGDSAFTALTPRQRLTAAAPARPTDSAACPHDHFGEDWSGYDEGWALTVANYLTGSGGIYGRGEDFAGVEGYSVAGAGVRGSSNSGVGVGGWSSASHGVDGWTSGNWSYHSGVYGEAINPQANGVTGWNTGAGVGVYGYSETGYAGYFDGPIHTSGNLSEGSGGFKIDHPLDPENQYLTHSFVESPDMKNIYDGVVVLDADGTAWVEMPAWFQSLNRDFRYQLTPMGVPGPNLYIAQEIQKNRFQIAGGELGLKVSWQVTGIRRDAYALAHSLTVEEVKPVEEQGSYLHPEEHGQPVTAGLEYMRNTRPEEHERGGE